MFANGAHRASKLFAGVRALVLAALVLGLIGIVATPVSAATTQMKVVIVVGPTGSGTAHNIADAKSLAAQARGYGAHVIEVYSPNATFYHGPQGRRGANVLIYMGHGSGWPSPYAPFRCVAQGRHGPQRHDLSRQLEREVLRRDVAQEVHPPRPEFRGPPSRAVLLGRQLRAGQGRSRPPPWAGRRVDNYSAGFLRTGAKAVFAEPYGSVSYLLDWVFNGTSTVREVFMNGNSGWGSSGTMKSTVFKSTRNTWATAISQRDSDGKFRRSVVGNLNLTAATVRGQ